MRINRLVPGARNRRGGPPGAERRPTEIADALRKAQEFLSQISGPPETEDEQRRRASTLHALDHATRLAEMADEQPDIAAAVKGGAEDARAAELCEEAMKSATAVVREVAEEAALSDAAAPIQVEDTPDALSALGEARATREVARRPAGRAPTRHAQRRRERRDHRR